MPANRLPAVLVVLGLLPLAGCGNGQAEVTGTVQLKGQPLAGGVVTFFPASGMPVAAAVQNGTYTIPVVPYGSYRVTVSPLAAEQPVTTGPGGPRKPTTGGSNAAPAAAAPQGGGPPIPAKYMAVDTSGLTCPVDSSKVTFPITLE